MLFRFVELPAKEHERLAGSSHFLFQDGSDGNVASVGDKIQRGIRQRVAERGGGGRASLAAWKDWFCSDLQVSDLESLETAS